MPTQTLVPLSRLNHVNNSRIESRGNIAESQALTTRHRHGEVLSHGTRCRKAGIADLGRSNRAGPRAHYRHGEPGQRADARRPRSHDYRQGGRRRGDNPERNCPEGQSVQRLERNGLRTRDGERLCHLGRREIGRVPCLTRGNRTSAHRGQRYVCTGNGADRRCIRGEVLLSALLLEALANNRFAIKLIEDDGGTRIIMA